MPEQEPGAGPAGPAAEVELKYIGFDGANLTGVPACDLSREDIKLCGYTRKELIDSGLYEPPVNPGTRGGGH